MKITVEIPDWAYQNVISVYAGTECLAYKYPDQPLMVKTGRCSHCGDCCKDWEPNGNKWFTEGGKCKFLNENTCSAGLDRPFICCLTPFKPYNENCTVTFEEQQD